MGTAWRIDCVRKDEKAKHPHHTITHVGGVRPSGQRFELPIEQAITGVRNHMMSFYTLEDNQRAEVYCHRSPSQPNEFYLTTSRDGTTANNLVSLRECPVG